MAPTGKVLATLATLGLLSASHAALAADVNADPASYEAALATLAPGDTLHLGPGTYTNLLQISGLNGQPGAWITIRGPDSGAAAVFVADPGPCCNTVELTTSSYLALQHLVIDGNGVDGAFGLSAKGGTLVHHIRVEDCTFLHHDTSQQNVAISTKTPTWGWEIRGNRIVGVGTGMYLGNSDGSDPFIGGIIENNLVMDSIGYAMQIKWQAPRPNVAGIPTAPTSTIIRHNVFIKNDGPSPDGDRPNVLVGGFPANGAGSEDRYEIYGNFFFHNPRESLLQASGRVTIHDNVFVDTAHDALLLADHDLPLGLAYVYNNTIFAADTGIAFGNAAPQGDAVVGNLVFAATPITGPIADARDNLTPPAGSAASYVTAPSTVLGQMDFYPLAGGACQGTALDDAKFAADLEHRLDFNGTDKGGLTFRGAYAGEGQNPGWQLDADVKGTTSSATGGSGAGAAPGTGGTSATGTGGASAGAEPGADGGCGCDLARRERAATAWLFFAAALALGAARARRTKAASSARAVCP